MEPRCGTARGSVPPNPSCSCDDLQNVPSVGRFVRMDKIFDQAFVQCFAGSSRWQCDADMKDKRLRRTVPDLWCQPSTYLNHAYQAVARTSPAIQFHRLRQQAAVARLGPVRVKWKV